MYWDRETQTYMTPNRHFNPRLGRWTQPDPFFHAGHGNLQSCLMQSGNLFVMTMNNPVRWVDPTGLFAIPGFGGSGPIGTWMGPFQPNLTLGSGNAREMDAGGGGSGSGVSSGGISLAGSPEDRTVLLSHLQMLTDHQLGFRDNGSVVIVRHAPSNSVLTYGNMLIERLIASKHTVTIMFTTGVNSFGAFPGYGSSTPGVGGGGVVFFNPNSRPFTYTVGDSGIASQTAMPLHIMLGHELIHADRAIRGVRIPGEQSAVVSWQAYSTRIVSLAGSFRPVPPGRYTVVRNRTLNTQLEEWAAIGLGHHTPYCITENMLRQEHGLQRRVSHGGRYR